MPEPLASIDPTQDKGVFLVITDLGRRISLGLTADPSGVVTVISSTTKNLLRTQRIFVGLSPWNQLDISLRIIMAGKPLRLFSDASGQRRSWNYIVEAIYRTDNLDPQEIDALGED